MAHTEHRKEILYLSLSPSSVTIGASQEKPAGIGVGLLIADRPQRVENGSKDKAKQKVTKKPVLKEFFF